MGIWGVGYGVNPKFVHKPNYVIENGVPNIVDYGSLLPVNGWGTSGDEFYLNRVTNKVNFDMPVNNNYTLLNISGIPRMSGTNEFSIYLGTTKGQENLLRVDHISRDITINISNISTPFYITFANMTGVNSFKNMTLI